MGWKIEFKIKKKGVHVIDRNFLREEIRSLSFFFIIIDRFMKRYSIDQTDGCNWTILFFPFFFFWKINIAFPEHGWRVLSCDSRATNRFIDSLAAKSRNRYRGAIHFFRANKGEARI